MNEICGELTIWRRCVRAVFAGFLVNCSQIYAPPSFLHAQKSQNVRHAALYARTSELRSYLFKPKKERKDEYTIFAALCAQIDAAMRMIMR